MVWIANQILKGRKIILHTDSSYKLKVPGVLHDRVGHCKKRAKVKGKWQWQLPRYVQTVTHQIPGKKGRTMKVKSGTQIVDRGWRFLKEHVQVNQHSKAGSKLLRAKLRSAQYEYWNRGKDLWVECRKLCSQNMAKFLRA